MKLFTQALLQVSSFKHAAHLLACLLFTYSSFAMAEFQSMDRIIAIVEDGVILQSQLDERISSIRTELLKSSRPMPPDNVLEDQILEQLILETIQLQLAQKAGIRIDDSTLSDTMEKIAAQNGKNLSEFKIMVEADGLNYREVRERIRNDLIMSRLRQKMVINRINITEQDVKNYLNSPEGQEKLSSAYHLAHILLPNSQEQEAYALSKKLNAGADFDKEAKKYGSQIDLGWRKVEQLPTLFVEPAQKLAIGEVSEPIKSASGFHIIKLLDKQGGDHKVVAQTRARHILIKPNEIRSQEDALHMINDIRSQILNGKDFAELARTYSEDPVSANDGGNLGWANPGDFVPEFEKAMADNKIGQVSEPFHTNFGWHILEVLERRDFNIGKEFQLNQARSILQQKQFEDEIQLWLREIRQDAFVEIKGIDSEEANKKTSEIEKTEDSSTQTHHKKQAD